MAGSSFKANGDADMERQTGASTAEARQCYLEALEIDPLAASVHCDIAMTHMHDVYFGWTDSRNASIDGVDAGGKVPWDMLAAEAQNDVMTLAGRSR